MLLENIYPIKSQDGDVIDVPTQCLSLQLQGLVRSHDPVIVYKRVVIIKENFNWSEEILSYMDDLILDRNCQLHVKVGVLLGSEFCRPCSPYI